MSLRPSSSSHANGEATVLLVGDINIQGRADPAEAFVHVAPTLRAADVVLGQLEGPFSPPSPDPSRPDIPHKQGWRHSDPAMAAGLAAAGFHAVSCASNVTYGADAILSSITTLDTCGIAHAGAGRTDAEARRPAIVERRGVRVGLLSYTSVFWPVGHAAGPHSPGVATIKATTAYQPHRRVHEMPGVAPIVITTPDPGELAMMITDVQQLRPQVDLLIVSCHWGVSGSSEVADYQQVVGRAAIDAGADLVFGHHPHVLQPVEVYRGRPIFYSLGNFAFDWEKMRGRNLDGLLVRCEVRGGACDQVSFVPVRRDDQNLIAIHTPADPFGAAIVARMGELSRPYGTTLQVEDGAVVVAGLCAQA